MVKIVASAFEINDIKIMKNAGIDALVFSIPFYSTRAQHYVEIKDLSRVKTSCRENDILMYVSVNRIFVEKELADLESLLKTLNEIDVDGIYFGDIAVLAIAQKLGMASKLIYNPDTILTNSIDANLFLNEGCQMVTLSKEISLDEICGIAPKVNGNVEFIIHGRLNMFNSKRKLLSNYFEFLEDQKHKYKDNYNLHVIEATREDKMPIVEDDLGTHMFTGFTLASFSEVKMMETYGVTHMRIDGIFQSLDYVVKAAQDYRAVLNGEADPQALFDAYKEADESIGDGFLHQKTIIKR